MNEEKFVESMNKKLKRVTLRSALTLTLAASMLAPMAAPMHVFAENPQGGIVQNNKGSITWPQSLEVQNSKYISYSEKDKLINAIKEINKGKKIDKVELDDKYEKVIVTFKNSDNREEKNLSEILVSKPRLPWIRLGGQEISGEDGGGYEKRNTKQLMVVEAFRGDTERKYTVSAEEAASFKGKKTGNENDRKTPNAVENNNIIVMDSFDVVKKNNGKTIIDFRDKPSWVSFSQKNDGSYSDENRVRPAIRHQYTLELKTDKTTPLFNKEKEFEFKIEASDNNYKNSYFKRNNVIGRITYIVEKQANKYEPTAGQKFEFNSIDELNKVKLENLVKFKYKIEPSKTNYENSEVKINGAKGKYATLKNAKLKYEIPNDMKPGEERTIEVKVIYEDDKYNKDGNSVEDGGQSLDSVQITIKLKDIPTVKGERKLNGDWVLDVKDSTGKTFPQNSVISIKNAENDTINSSVGKDNKVTIKNSQLKDEELKGKEFRITRDKSTSEPTKVDVPAKYKFPVQTIEVEKDATNIDATKGLADTFENKNKVENVKFNEAPDTSQATADNANPRKYKATVTFNDKSTVEIEIPVKVVEFGYANIKYVHNVPFQKSTPEIFEINKFLKDGETLTSKVKGKKGTGLQYSDLDKVFKKDKNQSYKTPKFIGYTYKNPASKGALGNFDADLSKAGSIYLLYEKQDEIVTGSDIPDGYVEVKFTDVEGSKVGGDDKNIIFYVNPKAEVKIELKNGNYCLVGKDKDNKELTKEIPAVTADAHYDVVNHKPSETETTTWAYDNYNKIDKPIAEAVNFTAKVEKYNAPTVTPDDKGSVKVTPPSNDKKVKEIEIKYTPEGNDQQETTIKVKKTDNGWAFDGSVADGITVDRSTGEVTIPADKVKDGSNVKAKSTNGETEQSKRKESEESTGTAGANPQEEKLSKPTVTPDDKGAVKVTPPSNDDKVKEIEIKYTPEGNDQQETTIKVKKTDNGWAFDGSVADGITVDSGTGEVTIPADKVKDGSNVKAKSTNGETEQSKRKESEESIGTTGDNPEAPKETKSPTINKVTEGDKVITGKGEPGANITVKDKNGNEIGKTTVDKDGNWKIDVPADKTLNKGDKITADQEIKGKTDKITTDTTVQGKVKVVPDNNYDPNWDDYLVNNEPKTPTHPVFARVPEKKVEETKVTKPVESNIYLEKLYMNGVGDNLFAADKALTRAEAAQILSNALKSDGYNKTVEISYKDIDAKAWYVDAIKTVTAAGVFEGYEDKTFKPEKEITKAEWISTLVRFQKLDKVEGNTLKLENHWALADIEAALKAGWLGIYTDGTEKLELDAPITRKEVAYVTNRALNKLVDKDYLRNKADNLVNFKDVDKNSVYFEEILAATNNLYRNTGERKEAKYLGYKVNNVVSEGINADNAKVINFQISPR